MNEHDELCVVVGLGCLDPENPEHIVPITLNKKDLARMWKSFRKEFARYLSERKGEFYWVEMPKIVMESKRCSISAKFFREAVA